MTAPLLFLAALLILEGWLFWTLAGIAKRRGTGPYRRSR